MQRKRPLRGKIFARCIPKRLFAGLFGCMARISCQREPVFGYMACESCREGALFPPEATFGMHGTQNLPRIAARECTVATSCHGSPFKNTPRRHLAEKALGCPALLRNRRAPRSRKTPPERSVGQFNNARRHVQETMKIFWCLSPRNDTENVLA